MYISVLFQSESPRYSSAYWVLTVKTDNHLPTLHQDGGKNGYGIHPCHDLLTNVQAGACFCIILLMLCSIFCGVDETRLQLQLRQLGHIFPSDWNRTNGSLLPYLTTVVSTQDPTFSYLTWHIRSTRIWDTFTLNGHACSNIVLHCDFITSMQINTQLTWKFSA